jgi:hypothetical protein
MRRRIEDLPYGSRLHHAARIHHRQLVAHLGDDAEVVGDEDQCEAMRALQLTQEVQILGLDRQVEAGGRLVGDEQSRLAGDGDGADDALAHAARHFVRMLPQARLRGGDAHRLQQLARPAPRGGPPDSFMHADRLRHLVADGEQRVQRGHGILQDHGDALAAHAAHLGVGFLQQVLALEQHPAAGHARRRWQEAQDGERQRALARSGLPDDAQGLAGIDAQRDIVDRAHDPRSPAET